MITGFFLSTSIYANDFECQNNFVLFENILNEELRHLEQGNVSQLIKFNNKYNYTALFKNNHTNQFYFGGQWIGRDEYESRLIALMDFVKRADYSIEEFKLISIKANRLTSTEEICVIPIAVKTLTLGKVEMVNNDLIFIRSLKENKWRIFAYLDSVKKHDFNEFFPDFPTDIQLKR